MYVPSVSIGSLMTIQVFLNSLDAVYTSVDVCDSSLNPCHPFRRVKGGLALIWKKSISAASIVLPEEDRIIGISIQEKDLSPIFIFCVYAPSSNSSLDKFFDKLYNLYTEYHSFGIFMGDFIYQVLVLRPGWVLAKEFFQNSLKALVNYLWFLISAVQDPSLLMTHTRPGQTALNTPCAIRVKQT